MTIQEAIEATYTIQQILMLANRWHIYDRIEEALVLVPRLRAYLEGRGKEI